MSLDTETIIERRRLRRKIGLWRGIAVAAFVLAVGALAFYARTDATLLSKPQIARITVTGLITEDRRQLELLKRLAKAGHVKGVIVFVNSAGGSTTGGEALYEGLRELAKKKPVVAQFGTVAASAAYMAGLATDHIVARGNSITGSVGVIMQWPQLTGLFDKIGVKMQEVKSGKLKAAPSPFQPIDPEARRVAQEMVEDGQRWFLGLVKERRRIDPAAIPGLAEGRIFSGRVALRHKLVDAIGGEDVAVKWLVDKRKVPANLDIVDWKPTSAVRLPLVGAIADFLAAVVVGTVGRIGAAAQRDNQLSSVVLDGLTSVWHPAKN